MSFRALVISLSMFFCLTANNCCVSSGSNAITKELKTIEKEISLPYHHDLDKSIEKYNQKSLPEVFLAHEAFIEEELGTRNLPLELKYLPLAFSEMQPGYHHDGRCGVWAMPALTGMHYGLIIDERHDERYSVEASTKAALDYLSDLHKKYNDWWHAILAFSSSPNALQHALSKSGKDPELWDFYDQKLIPNSEIISDFIACVCVYHDHQTGDTLPKERETTEISFSQPISIEVLAQKTGLSVERIKALNPVYCSDVFVPLEHYPLVLPNEAAKQFVAIEIQLYEETIVEAPTIKEEPKQTVKEEPKKHEKQPKSKEKTIIYKVKKGDTLSHIAKKHHVTISELIEWNHLESDFIREGQELIIKK